MSCLVSWKTNLELEEQHLNCVIPTYAPRHCKVNINKSYSTPRELPFSVPQGSCAGPVLYSVYALTIQHTIINDQISLYGYADDHGLRMTCKPDARSETSTVKRPPRLFEFGKGLDG